MDFVLHATGWANLKGLQQSIELLPASDKIFFDEPEKLDTFLIEF